MKGLILVINVPRPLKSTIFHEFDLSSSTASQRDTDGIKMESNVYVLHITQLEYLLPAKIRY